jgi:hypothetical protein
MYFTRQLGNVCHILDERTGRAPTPCGARLEKVALMHFRAGEPSRFITAQRPVRIPLCKHCQKSQSRPRPAAFETEPEQLIQIALAPT